MTTTAKSAREPIDTSKVPNRRHLHFKSVDEALREVDQLAVAERAGGLTQLGNWTLGQALGHVATWAEYSYTGAPLKVPFIVKFFLRMGKKKFLYSPMKAGVRIPRVPGGTLAIDPMPLDEAQHRCRSAFERLDRQCPTHPNIIFGTLMHAEWINLNLRHAELHLSFFELR